MQLAIDWFYRFLNFLLVVLLSSMVIMVFGNVILRYAFNTGWTISEELSRFFFVWVTFIGAVVAFRNYGHMGIETLVARLSRRNRLICMAISNFVIMACSFIFAFGAFQQLDVNFSMYAPVSGLALGWVYGIGIFTGTCMFVIAAQRFLMVLFGRVSDEEIARFAGEFSDISTAG